MRRCQPIAVLAVTALALPSAAVASTPDELLATAAPLSDAVPAPQHAPSLSSAPVADAGNAASLLAATPQEAGELLAQAPPVTATPPVDGLPRTGAELWLTLLAGGGLLLTGTGLRLRLGAVAPDEVVAPSVAR